jgi:hypothetical protein
MWLILILKKKKKALDMEENSHSMQNKKTADFLSPDK